MRVKEGLDLKRINDEYRGKKGPCKVKQETKISNQPLCTDRNFDGDKITDFGNLL